MGSHAKNTSSTLAGSQKIAHTMQIAAPYPWLLTLVTFFSWQQENNKHLSFSRAASRARKKHIPRDDIKWMLS